MTSESVLKRQAIQILTQLPEDSRDARRVLELARTFIDDFLDDHQSTASNLVSIAALRPCLSPRNIQSSDNPGTF